jgi:hypothetical protein
MVFRYIYILYVIYIFMYMPMLLLTVFSNIYIYTGLCFD